MPRNVACEQCGKALDQAMNGRPRKYCGQNCRYKAHYYRQKAKAEKPLDPSQRRTINDPAIEARLKGKSRPEAKYEAYREWSLLPEHMSGRLTDTDVAAVFGVDQRTAGRWLAFYRRELRQKQQAKTWQPKPEHQALLAPNVEAFVNFYKWLIPGTPAQPTDIAPFHEEWIGHIIDAEVQGSRIAIQGPQRFGKTMLMVVAIVRKILIDPNVCILFVGRTKDLAGQTTGLVRQILEENEKLAEFYLPDGASFRPTRSSSLSWTNDELTVATRTAVRRSPTLTAVGAGGTLLGRDADAVYADDLEDFRNAQSPSQRDNLKRWFTSDLASRKEEHTSMVYIGSAQHPEDLLSLLRQDPQWKVIVYSAHNSACDKELWRADPHNPAEPANPQDHETCVLWPKVRSYRWLFTNRQQNVDKVQWDMNMLGEVADGDLAVFPVDLLQQAIDPMARMGEADPSWRLIAGIDPGGGGQLGWMAALLWGIDGDGIRHVVDIADVPGGGLQAIRDVMHSWHQNHGVTDWVVEMNLASAYIYDDHTLSEMRQRNGLRIIEHRTYANKLDSRVGVPSLKQHFADGKIKIPYGDARSQNLADEMIRQFRRFSPRAKANNHYRFDMVMAAWFPEQTIRSWEWTSDLEVNVEYASTPYGDVFAGAW